MMKEDKRLRRYNCTLSQEEIDIIQRLLSSERHRLDNMKREHPYRIEITALMEAFGGYNVKVDIEGLIEI
jgi:hypothetical protein